MIRLRLGGVALLLSLCTLWGCTQSTSQPSAKTTRLQEEVRALATARDQLRQDLQTTQTDKQRLNDELTKLRHEVKERDELLAARTAERDRTASQLDQV